jgi:hypothetical protein
MAHTFKRRPLLLHSVLIAGALAGCGGGGGAGGGGGGGAASPLNPFATITGSSSLDSTNSVTNTGNATQSGTLVVISGALEKTATFSGNPAPVPPTPAYAQTARISSVNDGVGARIKMSGRWDGAPAQATTDGLFADFAFDIANTSTTRSLRVTFRVDLSRLVAATGLDTFAYADLSIRDANNNELYFFERRVDTGVPGNEVNLESATDTFSVDVTPGATHRITGLQRLRGGAMGNAGSYRNEIDAIVVVDNVVEI